MYEEIASNNRRSWVLMLSFVLLVGVLGWVIGEISGFGLAGPAMAIIIAIVLAIVSYYKSDTLVLKMSSAHVAKRETYPHLYNAVEGLAIAAGIPAPKLYIVDDTAPNAFATGRDPEHAAIAVTSGLLEKMDRLELEGVIAHEMSHIKNYDIKLMTLTVVMVGVIALLSDWLLRSFWWGGRRQRNEGQGGGFGVFFIVGIVLAIAAPIVARLIRLAVSRQREYLADASASLLTRYPAGLANALRKIAGDQEPLEAANKATAHLYISPPKQRGTSGKIRELATTHPPVEERIKRLEGMALPPT